MTKTFAKQFFLCFAFNRPYLSNGRAISMVVVCLSVRHGCIVGKR